MSLRMIDVRNILIGWVQESDSFFNREDLILKLINQPNLELLKLRLPLRLLDVVGEEIVHRHCCSLDFKGPNIT